jgi:hypothetical protein
MGLLPPRGVGPPFRPDQKVKLDKTEAKRGSPFLRHGHPPTGAKLGLGEPARASLSLSQRNLSKNEVLSGLTYFYSNSVSQAGKVGTGLRSRTMSAARQATSRKAREAAHPQLFRYTFKDEPALYFRLKWPTRPLSLKWPTRPARKDVFARMARLIRREVPIPQY